MQVGEMINKVEGECEGSYAYSPGDQRSLTHNERDTMNQEKAQTSASMRYSPRLNLPIIPDALLPQRIANQTCAVPGCRFRIC